MLGGLLVGLASKGTTVDELVGAATMRWNPFQVRSSKSSFELRVGKPCNPSRVPPTAYTMCRNGPVSSSRTGPTPKRRVYQASLTDRSVTVTATCEMAGMVPEMATMIVLCLMWLC